MVICFNGIDGSGKSLQAERLVAQLNAAGFPAVHVWTGGKRSLRRPFVRLGKRLLKRTSTAPKKSVQTGDQQTSSYQSYLSSTQKVFRRAWLRKLWENVSLFEHMVEVWAQVIPHILRGRIVVCDRYLHDTIVRVAVLAGIPAADLPQQLTKLKMYRTPRITLGFLIDISAEVAFSRKNDIPDITFLEPRIPLYRAAAQALNFHILDGTGTPDEIASAIWGQVQPLLGNRSIVTRNNVGQS